MGWGAAHQDEGAGALDHDVKGAALGPDHAGIFETTLIGVWPERVEVSRLQARHRPRQRSS